MMVDGSPRRIPPPPEPDNSNQQQQQQQQNNKTPNDTREASSGAPPVPAPADSSSGVVPPAPGAPSADASASSRTSRSRWMKLRTTVQLSGAITQVHKKPPLKREDSFLKRFSTRQIVDPNAIEGSSRRGVDGMVKGPFFGTWRSVVNPDENILFYWLSLLTICLLYNAWTIIARQAFPELQQEYAPAWYCLDYFTDLVFFLDIAFQFRTGYLEQGLMVCESKKLAGHYFKSKSFLMDLIAITPLDLIQLKVGILPIVRFPRFLKVYRSFRFYYMVESRTIYPNLWRVVNLIHILLLLAHWFGCFYYMLSELEGFVGEWSYKKPIGEYAALSRKYLGSVYWSTLTLTTIGDLATPVTNLQYLFTIVSYLIGVFIFATIVGQVGNVITNRNASRLEFERLLDGAKLYMRHHKVPRNMQRRVQRWYDYSWSRGRMQGGGDINSALGILPDKLKTELALHVNLKTLKKVSIFQECQPEFLHDLVLKMKAYIFTPGDLICRKGEVAREMFIIADGILEVISETGKVLTQMMAGDFFGEIGILNLDGFNRRTADVRSVGYSELFSLSREDILAAMKDYPEAQEILQTMGRRRLMEARLAANVGKSGANSGDTNVSSSKKGLGDLGRKGLPKPRTAVSKLKNDVRSLKKLLRTRSTPTGKGESEEQVEMRLIPPHPGGSASTVTENMQHSSSRRRNASIKMLMRKMHLRGEERPSSVKGLAECLSNIRSRPERSGVAESSSISTESSADSSTPLNKALPLLQNMRLLREQERKGATIRSTSPTSPKNVATAPTHEIIGEGLPFLERLKLLRAKEQAQNSAEIVKLTPKEEIQKPSVSPKSRHKPLSSLIPSAISPGSTSPKLLPKKETMSLKSARAPEYTGEIPLLKKVLLMKIMEPIDKKSETASPDPEDGNHKLNNSCESINKESTEQKNGNNSASAGSDSEKVYLEQFSRTLGFQMSQLSEDVVPLPKPQPRARLNAMSLTPSPSKENVNVADSLKQAEPVVIKESKKKSAQTQIRKGRLSRMMAVREDSDENSTIDDDDEEDPFVKSTEVQTEDEDTIQIPHTPTASSDSLNGKDSHLKGERLEDGIQDYLVKMMNNMKLAMKAYVVEQQQELQKRIIQLETDTRKKDELIKKLRIQLNQQFPRASSTFDEVSSIDPSSLSVSETDDNDSVCVSMDQELGENEQDEEDEERDLDDEEIRVLQEKLKSQRKSWPTAVNIRRRKISAHKKSYSLDEEQQPVDIENSNELWRLEFPQPSSELTQKVSSSPSKIISTIPEKLVEESSFPESEEEDRQEESTESAVNRSNWEVQMLVQQFDKNLRQQRRRHTCGEALTWDNVLHLRNVALKGEHGPESGRISNRHHRRKYSLVEEGSLRQWTASSMVQSSSHTSLIDARGGQKSMVKSPRRRSSIHQKHFEPPSSSRKSSLPILPQCSSIGMSRWLSMDDAKSDGCRSQDSSLHTTLSSAYSQETVIGVESRFSSVDDVRRERKTNLGIRSPSSPNVVTDRDCTTSFEYATASGSHLPEWPSSPCLPTISEDEQSHIVVFSPTTSTGRSASLSMLPSGNQPSESFNSAQSFQTARTFTGTSSRRRASADFSSREQARSSSTPDNLCLGSRVTNNIIAVRGVSNNNIVDTQHHSSQSSVVISIPEYEPLLSP